MVEWIQNKTLWQWKCWIFLYNKNQKIYPPKYSFIWQRGRWPWSIYPNKNGSPFFLHKIQIQETNTKTKRYSQSPQRWTQQSDRSFYKNSLTMMSQITIQVQQSLLQNPELKIFRIHKILTICDKNKIQKVKERSSRTSWPLAKGRAIAVNKISFCRLRQNYRQTVFITVPRLFTIHLQYRHVTIHEQSVGQHFQKLHRAKRLPFDNCSPTFGAWQLDIVTPPLLSSIQLYITPTFHSDKSSKKE